MGNRLASPFFAFHCLSYRDEGFFRHPMLFLPFDASFCPVSQAFCPRRYDSLSLSPIYVPWGYFIWLTLASFHFPFPNSCTYSYLHAIEKNAIWAWKISEYGSEIANSVNMKRFECKSWTIWCDLSLKNLVNIERSEFKSSWTLNDPNVQVLLKMKRKKTPKLMPLFQYLHGSSSWTVQLSNLTKF